MVKFKCNGACRPLAWPARYSAVADAAHRSPWAAVRPKTAAKGARCAAGRCTSESDGVCATGAAYRDV